MYNRSLVCSTVWFGLCSIILLCSTGLLGIMNVFCVFIWLMNYVSFLFVFSLFQEVWTIYKGSTHSGYHFFRRRIALSLSPLYLSPDLHFGFTTRRKARRILSLSFFFVCLRTGGTLFNSLKWMILEFKIVGLVTFIEFRLVGFHTRGVNFWIIIVQIATF